MTSDAEFAAMHDAYIARQYEEAHDAELRSYTAAARPNARPEWTTYGRLGPGDFFTNEGPHGRWVLVERVDRGDSCNVRRRERNTRPAPGCVVVVFSIPEPVTVNLATRYSMEREEDERVMYDASVSTREPHQRRPQGD